MKGKKVIFSEEEEMREGRKVGGREGGKEGRRAVK